MKKIIRPEGPAKKITLLRYCPKKKFRPRPKSQAPPRISNGPCLSQLSIKYELGVVTIALKAIHKQTQVNIIVCSLKREVKVKVTKFCVGRKKTHQCLQTHQV